MASITHPAARHNRSPDDDFDARRARIIGRILDGVEQRLDELEQPAVARSLLHASIARVVHAHIAPLSCGLALCQRARRCRGNPCTVPRATNDDRA